MTVYGYDDKWVWVEYIEGLPLSNRGEFAPPQHKRCFLDSATAVDLRPIWRAVRHMHSNGLCHTDINSHNIMVRPDGTMKLIDTICCLPYKRRIAKRDRMRYEKLAEEIAEELGADNVRY
jgi:serine/threonine protein kinase